MQIKNNEYNFEDESDVKSESKGEQYVSIIKCGFAFPYGDIYGLMEIVFDESSLQTDIIHVVVDFDSKLFSVSPNQKWLDFENRLIDLANSNNRNERLSDKLHKKIDKHINYKNYQKVSDILSKQSRKQLKDFILNFIITLYGYPECKIIVSQQRIPLSEYDLVRNKESSGNSSFDDEYDETEDIAFDGSEQISGELVISPIFGVPVYRLVIGDIVCVLPHELVDGESEVPERVKAVVESISNAENGAMIVAKSEDGLLFKVFEYENIKVKCFPKNRSNFMFNMFRNHFDWILILFFLLFAIFLFGIIGI